MDVRFGGAAGRNLRVFKRLCGEDNLGSVVMATTFWKNVDPDTGAERESQLHSDKRFWKDMIEKGSSVFRQDRGKASGEVIIRYLINRKNRVTLRIQHELVKERKTFAKTDAGIEVLSEWKEQKERYEKQIETLKREKEALKKADKQEIADVDEEMREYETKIDMNEEAVGRLRRTWDYMRESIEDHCVVM
ncbi:MAG: hypothetical protein Q9181_008200 [Wetmoreana brouardii]